MANWFAAYTIDPSGWYESLRKDIPSCIRSFHPEDLHMTVAFLGNINENILDKITQVIKNYSFKNQVIRGPEYALLPSSHRFSAFCIAFKNSPNDFMLQSMNIRNQILQHAGLPAEKRNFLPHVTLGRPLKNITMENKKEIMQFIRSSPLREVQLQIDTLCIYTWSNDRKEKLFKIVQRHKA